MNFTKKAALAETIAGWAGEAKGQDASQLQGISSPQTVQHKTSKTVSQINSVFASWASSPSSSSSSSSSSSTSTSTSSPVLSISPPLSSTSSSLSQCSSSSILTQGGNGIGIGGESHISQPHSPRVVVGSGSGGGGEEGEVVVVHTRDLEGS